MELISSKLALLLHNSPSSLNFGNSFVKKAGASKIFPFLDTRCSPSQ